MDTGHDGKRTIELDVVCDVRGLDRRGDPMPSRAAVEYGQGDVGLSDAGGGGDAHQEERLEV